MTASPVPLDALLEVTSAAEQRHFWFRGFRRFITPLLERAAAGRLNLRLLDCGCGTGANLDLLQRYGRSWGVDITWTGLRHARRRGQARTARASVTDLPFPGASFDIATSFDVLYCLHDPEEAAALAEMRRVLVPGGHALINVAGMPLLRGSSHSVVLGGEVRRYTTQRMRMVLQRAGFDVLRLTYTNATLVPLLLPVRIAQRGRGGHVSHDEAAREMRVPAAPVNASLTMILAAEAQLLRVMNMPFGSSVLALARRPARS